MVSVQAISCQGVAAIARKRSPVLVTPKTPGERIRALRKARGWNQQTLATKAGAQTMTISKWERDVPDRLDPRVLAGLAEALEVDESYIVYGDDGGDTELVASGWKEWIQSDEAEALTDRERSALLNMGRAATAEGYRLTPGAYSAWRVALQMFGNPPTRR